MSQPGGGGEIKWATSPGILGKFIEFHIAMYAKNLIKVTLENYT